jgi:hypothetical protein
MVIENASMPWHKKLKYRFLLLVLAVLLILSFLPYLYQPRLSASQLRLNKTIDYFTHNYNLTTGLIPEIPGSHTYWLYSDNYLVALALSRYGPRNGSTSGFASAIETALNGYRSTVPPSLLRNQYTALNSSSASFDCSSNHALSWTGVNLNGSAVLMTTANDLGPSCASGNYVDLILLQALYEHRLGNTSSATLFYNNASSHFDGYGFKDLAYISPTSSSFGVYQTFKVALYVYATYCLGVQKSSPDLAAASAILREMQSNLTGGFTTGYASNTLALGPALTPVGGVNTETTALAALALEQMISPSASC